MIWRDNYIHHNDADGIWFDGAMTRSGTVIERNRIEDNGRTGITFEVSAGATIRDNTIQRNQGEAVLIANSTHMEIHANTLTNNAVGVGLFQDCARPGQPDLLAVSAHDNNITVPAGAYGAALTFLGNCTAAMRLPFLNGTQQLTLAANRYVLPSLSGNYWVWESPIGWAAWQKLGRDVAGTIR